MLTLGLSYYVLEIPIDVYTTLSQFWLAVQHSVKSTASWLVYIGNNEKATLNLNMAPLACYICFNEKWVFVHLSTYSFTTILAIVVENLRKYWKLVGQIVSQMLSG